MLLYYQCISNDYTRLIEYLLIVALRTQVFLRFQTYVAIYEFRAC